MTPSALTAEEICEIAREVTQQPFKYLRGHVILDGDNALHYWNPAFDAEDWMRSQALAVVEWLASKIMNEPILDPVGTKRGQLMRAIVDKNTNSLMSMVLELRGENK